MRFGVRTFENWEELRNLRLRALEESPEWFAAKIEVESARNPEDWERELETAHWRLIADSNNTAGMMAVSKAVPLRAADCWLFGCWIACLVPWLLAWSVACLLGCLIGSLIGCLLGRLLA